MRIDRLVPSVILVVVVLTTKASSFVIPSDRSINKRLPKLTNRRGQVRIPSISSPIISMSALNMSPDAGRKLVTMGRVPWSKLRLSKSQCLEIIAIIRSETHTIDLSLMLILGEFYIHK